MLAYGRGFSGLAALRLGPLHHVTIVSGDVRRAAAFYRGVLGLRCVKRTVNYDDPASHHLFFGDGVGRPGSLLTLFEWSGFPAGRPGIGTLHHAALRCPSPAALAARVARLRAAGATIQRAAEQSAEFQDPEGFRLQLVAGGASGDGGAAAPADGARLDHVLTVARDLDRTAEWCERVLGLPPVASGHLDGDRNRPLLTFGSEASLRYCAVRLGGKPVGHVGPGTAHHVAFSVAGDEELRAWTEHLRAQDVPSTPVLDRLYFRSVYFRDPDGNVFELATDGPGLSLDEAADDLGGGLRLPPWLESLRPELAAGLSAL